VTRRLEEIEATRASWAARTELPSKDFRFPLHMVFAPSWVNCRTNARTLKMRSRLWKEGTVCWGGILMAPPGSAGEALPHDDKIVLAFSTDPLIDRRPELLDAARKRFWAARQGRLPVGTSYLDSELLAAWPDLSSSPLPRAIALGRVVWISTAPLFRAHLPAPRLANIRFPIVTLDEPGGPTMILPKTFWAKALVDEWLTDRE